MQMNGLDCEEQKSRLIFSRHENHHRESARLGLFAGWVLVACVAGVGLVHAGVQGDVARIRKRYQQVRVDKGNYHSHSVRLNVVYAAIGLQTTKIEFIHRSWQANPERDPYLMRFCLGKVRVQYNIAASRQYRQEYLFDRRGRLIFYFRRVAAQSVGGPLFEERYYLRGNRLLKAIVKGPDPGGSGKNFSYTLTAKFRTRDRKRLQSILMQAARYKALFKKLVVVEKLK